MKDFVSKMKEYLDKGVEVSKGAIKTAGTKVQDFGDKSVTRIEIKQLESKAQKELASLGLKVYELFVKNGETAVSSTEPSIKEILESIESLNKDIDSKTDSLQ